MLHFASLHRALSLKFNNPQSSARFNTLRSDPNLHGSLALSLLNVLYSADSGCFTERLCIQHSLDSLRRFSDLESRTLLASDQALDIQHSVTLTPTYSLVCNQLSSDLDSSTPHTWNPALDDSGSCTLWTLIPVLFSPGLRHSSHLDSSTPLTWIPALFSLGFQHSFTLNARTGSCTR